MKRLLFLLTLLLLPVVTWAAAVNVTLQRKVYSGTAADGTWRQVQLPANTSSVWIEVSGAAWIDGIAGGYTDDGARSSGGRATTSGEVVIWPIPLSSDRRSIWVAGNGASRTITVIAFGKEAQ